MKDTNKGLGLYDKLDLSARENDQELLDVYRKWASIYDQDNDDVLGTVSQPNSVQIFHKHLSDKNQKIIDVGGEPYMHDKRFIGAEFDFEEIAKRIGSEKSYALGAGSVAMSCLFGHCGEFVINENFFNN